MPDNTSVSQHDKHLMNQCRREARKRGLDPDEPSFKAYCTRLYNQKVKDIDNIRENVVALADDDLRNLKPALPVEYRGLSAKTRATKDTTASAKKSKTTADKKATRKTPTKPAKSTPIWPGLAKYLSNLKKITNAVVTLFNGNSAPDKKSTGGLIEWKSVSKLSADEFATYLDYTLNLMDNWSAVGSIKPVKEGTLKSYLEKTFGKPAHSGVGDYTSTFVVAIYRRMPAKHYSHYVPNAFYFRIVSLPYEESAEVEIMCVPIVKDDNWDNDLYVPFNVDPSERPRPFEPLMPEHDDLYCDVANSIFGGYEGLEFSCWYENQKAATPGVPTLPSIPSGSTTPDNLPAPTPDEEYAPNHPCPIPLLFTDKGVSEFNRHVYEGVWYDNYSPYTYVPERTKESKCGWKTYSSTQVDTLTRRCDSKIYWQWIKMPFDLLTKPPRNPDTTIRNLLVEHFGPVQHIGQINEPFGVVKYASYWYIVTHKNSDNNEGLGFGALAFRIGVTDYAITTATIEVAFPHNYASYNWFRSFVAQRLNEVIDKMPFEAVEWPRDLRTAEDVLSECVKRSLLYNPKEDKIYPKKGIPYLEVGAGLLWHRGRQESYKWYSYDHDIAWATASFIVRYGPKLSKSKDSTGTIVAVEGTQILNHVRAIFGESVWVYDDGPRYKTYQWNIAIAYGSGERSCYVYNYHIVVSERTNSATYGIYIPDTSYDALFETRPRILKQRKDALQEVLGSRVIVNDIGTHSSTPSQFMRELGNDVFERLTRKDQATIDAVLAFYERLPAVSEVTSEIITPNEIERIFNLLAQ